MVCLARGLRAQATPHILFLIALIFFNDSFSNASVPKSKRELKSVKFVQKGQPAYVTSSSPGSYFRHMQTMVEQDSSSSAEETSEKEQTPSKSVRPKYRYVHAPVGYEKSTEPLFAEVQSLKEINEKLSAEVKAQAQKIKTLKEQLDSESKRIVSIKLKSKGLKEELKKKEKQTSSLLTSISQKDKTIAEQKEDILSLEKRLQEKDRVISDQKVNIASLEKKLQESMTAASDQKVGLASMERRLQEKESALEARERSLYESEGLLIQKQQNIQRREEDLARTTETIENEVKLNERIESLLAEKETLVAKQASIEDDKKQLEAKLLTAISERDEAKKALNNCLESLQAAGARSTPEKAPFDTSGVEEKRKVFDKVIKQMKGKQKKWVKAPPFKRPEAISVEESAEPEVQRFFASMKKKKEAELNAFIEENGLQNEDRERALTMYEKFKENNMTPSPSGIQQFDRFKKEEIPE